MKRLIETKRLIDILDVHPDIALETLQRARMAAFTLVKWLLCSGKELEARENELGERARRDVVHRARHEEGAQKAPGLLADRKEVHGAASSDTRPSCDESLTRIPTGSESFL